MQTLPYDRLVDFSLGVLRAHGLPEADARDIAELPVIAAAMGSMTHGLRQIEHFDERLGGPDAPAGTARIAADHGPSALIDGSRCLGHLAARLAVREGIARARRFGSAVLGAGDTGWVGALGPFLPPVADAGMLGIFWVQHAGGKDAAPFGGLAPRLSTNPLALTFPIPDADPVLADFSTSSMSFGATRRLLQQQRQADAKVYLDAGGRPSRNPRDFKQGGSMQLLGGLREGYKGFALSLWHEALTAAMGGSTNNPERRGAQSFALLVLDPARFGGRDAYGQQMRNLADWVLSSPPRDDAEVRLPGRRAFAALAQARAEGVPVEPDQVDTLRRIADRLELPRPG